jgi:hypothetical protein
MKALVDVQPVGPAGPAPETTRRKLKAGMTHYANGQEFVGGQEVELTKVQEAAFGDKFEPSENPQQLRQADGPGVETETPEEQKQQPQFRPVPTSHTPQDIGAKTNTPGQPDVNVGNQTRLPQVPAATNPVEADQDTKGQPPVRDSYTAARVGGNVTPESLSGTGEAAPSATNAPAPEGKPTPATGTAPASSSSVSAGPPAKPTAAAADKKR